jgi:hypothetical protein
MNAEHEHYKRVTGKNIPLKEFNRRKAKNEAILERVEELNLRHSFGGWGVPAWRHNGYWWQVNFINNPDGEAQRKIAGDPHAQYGSVPVSVALDTLGLPEEE